VRVNKGGEDYSSGGASSAQDKPRLKKLRQLCNTPDRIHTITEGTYLIYFPTYNFRLKYIKFNFN